MQTENYYADSIDRQREHLARLAEINRRSRRDCLCIQIGSLVASWAICAAAMLAAWYWK